MDVLRIVETEVYRPIIIAILLYQMNHFRIRSRIKTKNCNLYTLWDLRHMTKPNKLITKGITIRLKSQLATHGKPLMTKSKNNASHKWTNNRKLKSLRTILIRAILILREMMFLNRKVEILTSRTKMRLDTCLLR